MAEEYPTKRDEIKANLHRTTFLNNFIRARQWEAEMEIGWLVSSPGAFIGRFNIETGEILTSHTDFETLAKLRGDKKKLNAGTLVSAEAFSIPARLTLSGLEAMIASNTLLETIDTSTTRFFGTVALNEPGIPIFASSKMQETIFVAGHERDADLAAKGIEAYLDQSSDLLSENEGAALMRDLATTNRLFSELRDRHADAFEKAVFEQYQNEI